MIRCGVKGINHFASGCITPPCRDYFSITVHPIMFNREETVKLKKKLYSKNFYDLFVLANTIFSQWENWPWGSLTLRNATIIFTKNKTWFCSCPSFTKYFVCDSCLVRIHAQFNVLVEININTMCYNNSTVVRFMVLLQVRYITYINQSEPLRDQGPLTLT